MFLLCSIFLYCFFLFYIIFFFNDTATTEIYTLSLTTLFRSSVHRFHARYQGIRGSGIWRYRFDSGRIYRRYPAWYHWKPCQGVYFLPAFWRDRILCPDYRASGPPNRYSRQEDDGESIIEKIIRWFMPGTFETESDVWKQDGAWTAISKRKCRCLKWTHIKIKFGFRMRSHMRL